jgi:hypothetical protein
MLMTDTVLVQLKNQNINQTFYGFANFLRPNNDLKTLARGTMAVVDA